MSQHSVKFDEAKRHAVYHRDGYRCAYCGHHDATKSGGGLSIDHIASRESGGEAQNTKSGPADNLITACGPCNYSKQAKSPRAYNAYRKANGAGAVDWGNVRAQAQKKIDIKEGERLAGEARAFRASKGEPMAPAVNTGPAAPEVAPAAPPATPKSAPAPDAKKPQAPTSTPAQGPGIHHDPSNGQFKPGHHVRRFDRSIRPGTDGVEFSADDQRIPIAFRVWREGVNDSCKGPVTFNQVSRSSVMHAYEARGMSVVFDYDHENTVPVEERRVAAADGYGVSSGRCQLALRGPELWAEQVQWTDRAALQIRAKERTQISPYFSTDAAGVVQELINIALCTEGATHRGADFAARLRRHTRSTGMQEMIAKLRATLEAIKAGGAGTIDEALEALASLEAVAGAADGSDSGSGADAAVDLGPMTEDMRRMGKDVEEVKQAMTRLVAAMKTPTTTQQAHGRAPSVDVIEGRRALVGVIVEKAPDGVVSADDARWMDAEANPELARRYVGGLVRLSRERPASGARPPANEGEGASGLSDGELRTAQRHGLTPEQFAKQKAHNRARAKAQTGN